MITHAWNYGYNIIDTGWVLNTGEQPIPEHSIMWCSKPFTLKRVVVGDVARHEVAEACSRLRVLCVAADSALDVEPGDIWVGADHRDLHGELAGETGWLRTVEAPGFPELLERLMREGSR